MGLRYTAPAAIGPGHSLVTTFIVSVATTAGDEGEYDGQRQQEVDPAVPSLPPQRAPEPFPAPPPEPPTRPAIPQIAA